MKKTHNLWSDEEVGRLLDMEHLTAAEAARQLGRTRKSVLHRRQDMRRGIVREFVKWSDADLDYVALHPEMTAEQLAKHLGKTYAAVTGARRKLREMGAAAALFGARKSDPKVIGSRTLIAKTCTECGLLLDASWFRARRGDQYVSRCRKCLADKTRAYTKRTRHPQRYQKKLQQITLERAVNNRKEWTGPELEVLADETRTNFEKAITLGRTYFGVSSAVAKLGLRSRKEEVGDPSDARWLITLHPEIAAMFQQRAA